MCLAAAQVNLLFLTARKADCELDIAILAARKMANTREASELSREKNQRMQQKKLAYYNNGQYHRLDYAYLMGGNFVSNMKSAALKNDNSVVLTDYNGRVVLNSFYANAIQKVLGNGTCNGSGRGSAFSLDKVPEILAQLMPGYSVDQIKTAISGGDVYDTQSYTLKNTLHATTISTGNTRETNITWSMQEELSLYYPIIAAAATNGWTTEYNDAMTQNSDFIGDALLSGVFQLAEVDGNGNYNPDTSLTYFTLNGFLETRYDADAAKEVEAWYDAEKAEISEKEDWIDLQMADLSAELEAIKTEIDSVKSFIDDAIDSVFDWGA